MLVDRIIKLAITQPTFLVPAAIAHGKTHSKSCPASKPKKVCPGAGGLKKKALLLKRGPVCVSKDDSDGSDGGGDNSSGKIRRALKTAKCRLGFIPNEWFLFFKPMTGVSGPYIFMIGLGNYLISKEIIVMEHEFYLGLSVCIVCYLATTKLGPKIGAALDEQVDAIANELEKSRKDELQYNEKLIKDNKTAIWRAEGQRSLMDVKKENIALQLEAIYRERRMTVFRSTRNRMEYQVRKRLMEGRVYQKWMIKWVLQNVHKAITPEFKQQQLQTALADLNELATRIRNPPPKK